jgi:hypothetical protein
MVLSAVAIVVDTRTGKTRRKKLEKNKAVLGSDPRCDIRLQGPGVALKHAEVAHVSAHIMLSACDAEIKTARGPLLPGKTDRVDRTSFELGPFRVKLVY